MGVICKLVTCFVVLEAASLAHWEAEGAEGIWVKLDLWPRLGSSWNVPGRAFLGSALSPVTLRQPPIFFLHWLTSDIPGLHLFPTEVNKHSCYVKIKGLWPLQVPWSKCVQNYSGTFNGGLFRIGNQIEFNSVSWLSGLRTFVTNNRKKTRLRASDISSSKETSCLSGPGYLQVLQSEKENFNGNTVLSVM